MAATKSASRYTTDDHFDTLSWADHYNLILELLPFQTSRFNPVPALDAIHTEFAETPDTGKTVNAARIVDDIPGLDAYYGPLGSYIDLLVTFTGGWKPNGKTRGSAPSYVNPDYIHLSHLRENYLFTDSEERHEYIEQVTKHGYLDRADIAPAFGMTTDEFDAWLDENLSGQSFEERQAAGRVNLACTIRTMQSWGTPIAEVAAALRLEAETLREFVDAHVPAGYQPPADPSDPMYEVPSEFRF